MQAFLAALVGGLLAIAGGLAAVFATNRGVKSQWRKDTQLKVSTEVLSALQKMVRRINDLAFLPDKESGDADDAWSAHAASATEWNNARHAALLVSSSKAAALLQNLDRQLDLLTTRAVTKQWTLAEFRKERDSLGKLAADYLNAARDETDSPPLQLESLWMWDQVVDSEPAGEPSKVAAGTSKPRLTWPWTRHRPSVGLADCQCS
jgi:hypothetical protein